MTGPEHYLPSRATVERVTRMGEGEIEDEIMVSDGFPGVIAAAQVHAVLALAAATTLNSDRPEWFNVAGSKLSDCPRTNPGTKGRRAGQDDLVSAFLFKHRPEQCPFGHSVAPGRPQTVG